MPKRTILGLAVAALAAIPAPGALAAMPAAPTQQEMDHGVQPTVESGYGDYSDTPTLEPAADPAEPGATESIPTPAEQGISTSPGAVELEADPAQAPRAPAQAQQAADEEAGGGEPAASCSELAAELDRAEAMSGIGLVLGNAIGGPIGSILRDEGVDWQFEVERVDEQAREQGCYAGEGSAA